MGEVKTNKSQNLNGKYTFKTYQLSGKCKLNNYDTI